MMRWQLKRGTQGKVFLFVVIAVTLIFGCAAVRTRLSCLVPRPTRKRQDSKAFAIVRPTGGVDRLVRIRFENEERQEGEVFKAEYALPVVQVYTQWRRGDVEV